MSLTDQLRDLYQLDQRVRGLRTRLDAALRRQKAQQTRLEQADRQHAELLDQHKVLQVKAQTLEGQARDLDARIDTLRGQMNNVKTNKEYSTLLVEVNTFKLEKSKIEDAALAEMTKLEALQKDVDAAANKLAEQRKIVEGAAKEVADAQTEVGKELAAAEIERDRAREALPRSAREEFDEAANIHDGQAMAAIVEESRRHMEYSCGGCYMQLPVERLNGLLRGGDEIVHCTSCGRILYIEKSLRESLATRA